MAFAATLESTNNVARITVGGELDASAAPIFRDRIEQAASAKPIKLVIDMTDLSYMASAGLRALIFAKQKMGSSVALILVGLQASVRETLEMTGFHQSVTLVDVYEEDQA
jgi:anti-anti-sigma factor